jgi:hypothetical protein
MTPARMVAASLLSPALALLAVTAAAWLLRRRWA